MINRNLKFKRIKDLEDKELLYTSIVLGGIILITFMMYYRAFFGTELTDQAYYVSEAKEILNGNTPFAYNYSSKAVGFTFPIVVIEAVYRAFNPSFEGVFLFCKLCFVTYKLAIAIILYWILQKKEKKWQALLLSGLLIVIDGHMQLFNYNYVPMLNMLLAGCLIFDVIEQDARHKRVETIGAGFLVAIGCFANPGWGVACVVFSVLIFFRITYSRYKRINTLVLFYVGIVLVVIIVVVPIIISTSFAEFWYGIYRLFISPIPVDAMYPNKTFWGVVDSFRKPFRNWFISFCPVTFFFYIISNSSIIQKEGNLTVEQRIEFSITATMFLHVIYLCFVHRGDTSLIHLWGFTAVCYFFAFGIARVFKNESIMWYLGIYPPLYTIAEIIILSNGANIGRFVNSYTVLIPIMYILLRHDIKLVRIMAVVMTSLIILSYVYIGFHYVYRDDVFHNLTTKVERGVYKGNYTTSTRAKDLPQLEEYLNSIIGENDIYAFRDNVPCAYLMVHKGKMCEMSTWDILQYSYGRNSPAILFDYYRVRNMIPDKIIYIDYGRDENLSNIEPYYRYNDWVNKYYNCIEDIKLNETFSHVIVYQYNGLFDGDYQWWIDNYWELSN